MELPAPFTWLDGQITVELPGARALFTTAAAGDLGLLTGDPDAPANRQKLEQRHGVRLAWRKQVHGHHVDTVDAPTDPAQPWVDGDGVASDTPGVAPLVLAADCLPIVISDGHGVVAVHAGWHGLDENVIQSGVDALARLRAAAGPGAGAGAGAGESATPAHSARDADDAPHLAAAIGPAAGPCCYEVGDELRDRFAAYDAERGRNLDLKLIAWTQLERAGVREIHDTGICTICSAPDELFSHRRDHGNTGRQAGIGWLTGPSGAGEPMSSDAAGGPTGPDAAGGHLRG